MAEHRSLLTRCGAASRRVAPLVVTLSPASPTGRGLATAVVRRLRDVVAWDEPWDYEDDDVIDPEPAATSVGV